VSAPVSAGFLHDDIPYLKIGQGPPLVAVAGLTPDHSVPRGMQRRMALATARSWQRDFTVYVVSRKRGLKPGESMSDIAGHLADANEHDLGEAVFLQGTSSGGSVALQLAVYRPELVRRLVVLSAAYRLGPRGRELQAEMARLIRAGRSEEAWAYVISAMLPGALRGPVRPISRSVGRRMAPADPTDALVTLEAEDAFDVEADLPRIAAPHPGGRREQGPLLYPGAVRGHRGRGPGWKGPPLSRRGTRRASTSPASMYLTLGFMLAGG